AVSFHVAFLYSWAGRLAEDGSAQALRPGRPLTGAGSRSAHAAVSEWSRTHWAIWSLRAHHTVPGLDLHGHAHRQPGATRPEAAAFRHRRSPFPFLGTHADGADLAGLGVGFLHEKSTRALRSARHASSGAMSRVRVPALSMVADR
ncbi:MAG: hypothetical protein JWQ55_3616, partial [Rhodopila sp.]|nr:hypothetical protein [Rhodopila sp.]